MMLSILSDVPLIYFIQEVSIMNGQINQSIKCTVQQCRHHAAGQNYCSLREIQIGTHEANPTQDQCTDCQSFTLK